MKFACLLLLMIAAPVAQRNNALRSMAERFGTEETVFLQSGISELITFSFRLISSPLI